MKKKLKTVFSLLLAVVLCLGMSNISAYATEADYAAKNTDTGVQYASLQDAIDNASAGQTVVMLEDIEEYVTVSAGQDITLDLAGHTLSTTGSHAVVTVTGSLVLEDSSDGKTGIITGGNWTNGSGIYVYNESGSDVSASVIMNGGTVTGNTGSTYGGGVSVGTGSSFTMNGGAISGNTGGNYGGGVYVYGTFTLNDGEISGNTNGDSGQGGGVYLYTNAVFNMNGGSISGNTSTSSGGGVYLANGGGITFNMTGGEISGNTASSTYGGGICNYGANTVNISGGTISGNTSTTYGGGIYQTSTGTLTISGGTISGNSGSRGGAVYANNGTLTITDGTISGNSASAYGGGLYLASSATAEISGGNIINNSAATAGDDIYSVSTSLTLTATPSGTLEECGHEISGWYDDSKNTRWSEESYTAVTDTAFTSTVALKAAHGPSKVSEPSIAKTADVSSVAAGGTVNYTLTSTVPETMVDSISYNLVGDNYVGTAGEYVLTFHDSLDDGLNLDSGSIAVTVNGSEIDAKYYTVDTSAITVAIDLAALYNDGMITEDDLGTADIVVTYSAVLAEDAAAGEYRNSAYVTWTGGGESVTDTVVVATFQLQVFKFDSSDNSGLAGASFELKDADGNVVATLTSGEDGYVTSAGLAEGTYYLTETAAPDGYVKSDSAVEVTVNAGNATDYIVTVNFANASIPGTGGMGTTLYTVLGLCILLAAGVVFMVSRKRRA